jgi:hypothetical protein
MGSECSFWRFRCGWCAQDSLNSSRARQWLQAAGFWFSSVAPLKLYFRIKFDGGCISRYWWVIVRCWVGPLCLTLLVLTPWTIDPQKDKGHLLQIIKLYCTAYLLTKSLKCSSCLEPHGIKLVDCDIWEKGGT